MASFTDRINSRQRTHSGTICGVGAWMKTIDAADIAGFNIALDDETVTGSDLHRVMQDMGFPYGTSSVRAHRNRDCLCRSRGE